MTRECLSRIRQIVMHPTVKDEIIVYDLKKLKLDSQSFSSSIGDNKTVTFDFTCQVGGPEQTDVGVFMSGYSTELAQQI